MRIYLNVQSFRFFEAVLEGGLALIADVDDQLGRLTFTRDMNEAISHMLGTHAASAPTIAPAPEP